MTFILCCPPNWADILAGRRGPSQILGGNWIDMGTNQGNFPEMGYGTWGAAVDFCVSQVSCREMPALCLSPPFGHCTTFDHA